MSFVALFLACIMVNNPEIEAPGFFLATAGVWALTVAFSRCVMGRHYLSDVIAGLMLGVLTVALVTQVSFMRKLTKGGRFWRLFAF